MLRMCMRHTQDEMTALSIVNDGFIKVFKYIHKYKHKGSFEGWIKRIIYNCICDHYRRKSSQFRFIEVRDQVKSPGVLNKMYYEDIINMVDRLDPIVKEVFLLHVIEGYKHREISEILGIPENTSKWHLTIAKQKLKSMIKKNNNFNKNQRNEEYS